MPTRTRVQPVVASVARTGSFLGQFVRAPGSVGALAPSSKFLARRMVEGVDLQSARAVLEFGPGTGAFTGEIARRLGPHTKFVAVELRPELAAIVSKRFPGVRVVNDDAARAPDICRREGLGEPPCVDAVISGLPWAGFPAPLQDRLLGAMMTVLKPGGVFVTFGYQFGNWLPAGRRFYEKACSLFESVEKSPVEWRNLPPAFVYRCVKGT